MYTWYYIPGIRVRTSILYHVCMLLLAIPLFLREYLLFSLHTNQSLVLGELTSNSRADSLSRLRCPRSWQSSSAMVHALFFVARREFSCFFCSWTSVELWRATAFLQDALKSHVLHNRIPPHTSTLPYYSCCCSRVVPVSVDGYCITAVYYQSKYSARSSCC